MCVAFHCQSLYQQVLHELREKVTPAMPRTFLGHGFVERAVDGMWRRIVADKNEEEWCRDYDIYWGLATEGYQQYTAYTVFNTVRFYPYFVVYSNDNYFKAHTVKWDRRKPWRDLWYEDETGFSPRNQWNEVLPAISPRRTEADVREPPLHIPVSTSLTAATTNYSNCCASGNTGTY